MHKLIAKYVSAYHSEQGSATEKVKKILMRHSHTWDWTASESIIADLIDDDSITAEDIVAFLDDTYEMEGGNDEFRYAVCAMQICLRKAELAAIGTQMVDAEEFETEETFGYDNDLYMPKANEILQTMQY